MEIKRDNKTLPFLRNITLETATTATIEVMIMYSPATKRKNY
jgi:hypothetical protein